MPPVIQQRARESADAAMLAVSHAEDSPPSHIQTAFPAGGVGISNRDRMRAQLAVYLLD